MLTNDQLFVLYLLRSSFDLTCNEIIPDNLKEVSDIILRNGILLTVYPKIKKMGADTTLLDEMLCKNYFATIRQAVNQENEGKQILKALSGAGMDCIALKGWEMRKYYPQKYMRQMVDLDILVRPYM